MDFLNYIPARAEFETSGLPVPYLKVVLRFAPEEEIDIYGVSWGILAQTVTDENGQFAFNLAAPASLFILEIAHVYEFYYGDQLISSYRIDPDPQYFSIIINEGIEFVVTVNDEAYDDVVNNAPIAWTNLVGFCGLTPGGEAAMSVRVELEEDGVLLASTYVNMAGNFVFQLSDELYRRIYYSSVNVRCRVEMINVNLIDVPFDPNTPLEFYIDKNTYNDYLWYHWYNVTQLDLVLDVYIGEHIDSIRVELLSGSNVFNVYQSYLIPVDDDFFYQHNSIQFLNEIAHWHNYIPESLYYNVFVNDVLVRSTRLEDINLPNYISIYLEEDFPSLQKTFDELVLAISNARQEKVNFLNESHRLRQLLKIYQRNLVYNEQYRLDTANIVQSINAVNAQISGVNASVNHWHDIEVHHRDWLNFKYNSLDLALKEMNDQTPILLAPVRIETTFQQGDFKELWVRIFPDDISVQTHEALLTEGEIEEGKQYWIAHVSSVAAEEKVQAWDLLCRSAGHTRAAWIALQTTPTNLANLDHNSLPGDFVFPVLSPKPEAWTQQPYTRVMPDAFVVICYGDGSGQPVYVHQGNYIPDELKLGLDPDNENAFVQENGNLSLAYDADWLIDFDAAVDKGMGVKVPINNHFWNTGFDKVIVIGVKASLNKGSSKARLEDLLNGHHYTSSISLLEQGANTKNGETDYSGYSAVEFGNKTTYATEREAPLFTPVTSNYNKTDGQILAEALGIEYDVLQHIYHSNGLDIKSAMTTNNLLWQVSWGYYLGTMMYPLINQQTINELHDFFADYVRSRGALPSIRCGTQPYGILPVSVYSRMNWKDHPRRGLFTGIFNVTEALDVKFTEAVARLKIADNTGDPNKNLSERLSRNAVSVEYVQRLGVGPGYMWNNLVYANIEPAATVPQFWENRAQDILDFIRSDSGLSLDPAPRITQVNFLEEQSTPSMPQVSDTNEHEPLPQIGSSGKNYLELIRDAGFIQLRDENFTAMGVPLVENPRTMLYQFARQSVLLEYYEAACAILGISESDKIEPELINFSTSFPPGDQSQLYTGPSRWTIMNTPYGGGELTMASFLDQVTPLSHPPEAVNLVKAKESLTFLSNKPVSALNLLMNEVADSASFRLDSWQLAFVNERLNALRGIQDGSSARNKDIFLGAYGWVADVKRNTGRSVVPGGVPGFPGTVERDGSGQGYIHAPSINQAVNAAVMRNAYVKRSDDTRADQFSVNISSARVRKALQIMEGVRNGQQLAALLGYDFERALHDHAAPVLDMFIVSLRDKYTLNNTVTEYNSGKLETVKARNVINGISLIKDFQDRGEHPFKTMLVSYLMEYFNNDPDLDDITSNEANNAVNAFVPYIKGIWDTMDAFNDLTVSEGMFHITQGNPVKAGGVTDAISKGNFLPEMDVVKTPRTGTGIYQRMTHHFEDDDTLDVAWSDAGGYRQLAEPYLNKWVADALGDPAKIRCVVTRNDTALDFEVSLQDLEIHALDLMYMVNDELADDDSELSLRVRKYVRVVEEIPKTATLRIDYGRVIDNSDDPFTFIQVLPLLLQYRKVITSCRYLRTTDYMVPEEAEGAVNEYDLKEFYGRVKNAKDALVAVSNDLQSAIDAYHLQTGSVEELKDAVFEAGYFGVERTVYEYEETDPEDGTSLIADADFVKDILGKKLDEIDGITFPDPDPQPPIVPVTIDDPDGYIEDGLQILKIVFGNEFRAIPFFMLRQKEGDLLNYLEQHQYGSLLNDYADSEANATPQKPFNPYLMDEWKQSIAKVRKNAASYELCEIITAAMNFDLVHTGRKMMPLQIPYAPDDTERWLGAAFTAADALKDGRVAFGVSAPAMVDFTSRQIGIMVDEWIDMIPNEDKITGVTFHHNQPNAKAPQCLLLALTPAITGKWKWKDLVDMVNETFDLAQKRAVDYEEIAKSAVGQLGPSLMMPLTHSNTTIGITPQGL